MTEQEIKRKKRRRKKKRSIKNVQNVEEPATKKVRLDSQELDSASQPSTKTQVALTSNSKGIINDTRVSEISGQEKFYLGLHFDTQIVSDSANATTVSSSLYTNGSHSVKNYTITEKDLIDLAQVKENKIDENKRASGRPVITFSISDNNLIHLELIQSKENDEINENFVSKEQIDNLKAENLRFENSDNKDSDNKDLDNKDLDRVDSDNKDLDNKDLDRVDSDNKDSDNETPDNLEVEDSDNKDSDNETPNNLEVEDSNNETPNNLEVEDSDSEDSDNEDSDNEMPDNLGVEDSDNETLDNLEVEDSDSEDSDNEDSDNEMPDNLGVEDSDNETLDNLKVENSADNETPNNLEVEDSDNETPENFKENENNSSFIQIGNNEVNGGIESQTGYIGNFKEHNQIKFSVKNSYIENSDKYEDSINIEHFEIFKKDNNLSKQFLRHTNSKHLRPGLQKYWHQRYLLFTLYDKGIMMDEEGWYSVTPEYLAEYLAKRCACDTIIDAMCGVGGNAIQFAKTCKKVIAIDIDETKLYCAKNNASIYGVEDKIEFILGDFYNLVPRLKADVVFLSPPWGGPSYLKSKVYDIKTMIPVDGERLFRESRKITKNIVYYVPRTINYNQMKILCDPDKICEIQKVIFGNKTRSYIVYYGDLVGNYCSEEIKLPRYWVDDTSEKTEY